MYSLQDSDLIRWKTTPNGVDGKSGLVGTVTFWFTKNKNSEDASSFSISEEYSSLS